MFQFVSVTHPDEFKDRQKQKRLREHAIRSGIKRSKAQKEKGKIGYNDTEKSAGKKLLVQQHPIRNSEVALTKSPSLHRFDPFNTLTGCTEKYEQFVQNPITKHAPQPWSYADDSGRALLSGMNIVLQGALSDPALFHALSLVLQLNSYNNLPRVECLSHRGHLLNGVRQHMISQSMKPTVSIIVAMLSLIGYEYRIDGANGASIATHIKGLQTVLDVCKARNIAIVDQVQKALFWMDMLCCLMAATTRALSHEDFLDFCIKRDSDRLEHYHVPIGFSAASQNWSHEFVAVLEDFNEICQRIDTRCDETTSPLDLFAVDNHQSNLQSRAVDCLVEARTLPEPKDHMYEACTYAAYMCAFKLYPGVWEGCYIPEVCVNQILRCISERLKHDQDARDDLMLWLLFLSGAMTRRKEAREAAKRLISQSYPNELRTILQNWKCVQSIVSQFIWCEYSFEKGMHRFWKHVVKP